nr:MAG TPA: hypothetical protein [Caudoviricetes sp.]
MSLLNKNRSLFIRIIIFYHPKSFITSHKKHPRTKVLRCNILF